MIASLLNCAVQEKLGDDVRNNKSNVDNVLCEALVDGRLMMDSADNSATKTLCFDCRGMGEPSDQNARHHFGTHPCTLRTFALDPQMKQLLVRLRSEIDICKTCHVGCIRLVVFDKRGRWAAMAVGKVFAEVALRSHSLTLVKVSFLMHYLESDCKGCDACAFWSRQWEWSNDVVAQMMQCYEGAGGDVSMT